jgi:hypothetical protein
MTDVFGLTADYFPIDDVTYYSLSPGQLEFARKQVIERLGRGSVTNNYNRLLIGVARGDAETPSVVEAKYRVVIGLYSA